MTITRVSDYSVYESRDRSCRLMECHDTSIYLACSYQNLVIQEQVKCEKYPSYDI